MNEPNAVEYNVDGEKYSARVLLGHNVTNEYVVIGLDGSEGTLVWLPLEHAAALSGALAKLVRSLQRKARRAKGGSEL